MRFPSRRGPTAKTAATTTTTYAVVVDDRWLWVVLPPGVSVTLRAAQGAVEVPVEVDDTQPGHHGVRLDLAALPDGDAEQTFTLHADGSRTGPLTGPDPRPYGPGTTHALTRDDAAHLHVVRRPVAAGATVRALRLVAASVEVDLDGAGPGEVLVLTDRDGDAVATLLVDSGTAVLDPDHLTGAAPGDLRASVRGLAVHRRANHLVDAGTGVPLPALHAPGEVEPRGRLRWTPDGSLVVRVHERPVG